MYETQTHAPSAGAVHFFKQKLQRNILTVQGGNITLPSSFTEAPARHAIQINNALIQSGFLRMCETSFSVCLTATYSVLWMFCLRLFLSVFLPVFTMETHIRAVFTISFALFLHAAETSRLPKVK
jgi:hypothetical protein